MYSGSTHDRQRLSKLETMELTNKKLISPPLLTSFPFAILMITFLVFISCFQVQAYEYSHHMSDTMDMGGDSMGYGTAGGSHHMGHDNPWRGGMMPHNDWFMLGGRSQPPACVPIPKNMTLCYGIRYDNMRLPNLLDHDTLTEAVDQAASWVPLISIRCHPDTQLFLCSLFSPVCLDRLIYPCRSVCEAVKSGCEQRMMKYGFSWPDMLNCEKFPLDNDLCIRSQAHTQPESNSCDACNQPDTFEGIIDNFCRADVVMRSKVVERKRRGDGSMDLVLASRKKVYKAEKIKKRSIKDIHTVLENGNTCDCPSLASTSKKDTYLIMANRIEERWITSFIMKKPKRSRDYRRAVKKFRESPCTKAVEIMTSEQQKGKTDTTKSKKPGRQTRKQRNSKKRQRQHQLRRNQQRGKTASTAAPGTST